MIPVEDMRRCPGEGRWMPVNHPCVGDNENALGPCHRAGGGNPHNKEIELNTQLIDAPVIPLTRNGTEYLSGQVQGLAQQLNTIRERRAELAAEMASMDTILAAMDSAYELLLTPLNGAVSLLPADPGPELPLEAEAHQAALAEQGRAGEHPYGPPIVTDLPPFNTGHVMVPGSFESQQLADGVVR